MLVLMLLMLLMMSMIRTTVFAVHETSVHGGDGSIIIPPLPLHDFNLCSPVPHLQAAPLKRHLKVHGVRKQDKGFPRGVVLMIVLGAGIRRRGGHDDDIQDNEALEEDEDVLEVGVVGQISHSDAGKGAEDVFEGIHAHGGHVHGSVTVTV
jgi:hypothetical protein